ncbi:MAG: hypothetical protein IPQ07_00500 [Myxococcales bacterium]|nr:hypothetical protein [Myxococcales bacterium]
MPLSPIPDPRRIELASIADVPSDPELVKLLRESGVVLSFQTLPEDERDELIARLRAAFPEHSTFWSGPMWVTILPIVPRARVLARTADVRMAITDYLATRRELMTHYRNGTLDPQWDASEHGGDCTFEHFGTKQVVEAPLWNDRGQLDPMFFAAFVRSTPAHARVAALLTRDFHDAARILELVAPNT